MPWLSHHRAAHRDPPSLKPSWSSARPWTCWRPWAGPSVDASSEVFGSEGTLGRVSAAEVVLRPRLRAALARLNPGLAAEGLTRTDSD